jgi:hypothetical protein
MSSSPTKTVRPHVAQYAVSVKVPLPLSKGSGCDQKHHRRWKLIARIAS